MRYVLLSCAVFVLLFACGCISPTPAMKMNAAGIADVSKELHGKGCKPGSELVTQLAKMAVTNEQIIGSPEKRLDIGDIAGLEANRQQAEKDAKAGGFWPIFGASALGALGVVAGFFGLTGVAKWAGKKSEQLAEATDKIFAAEKTARGYADKFTKVVRGAEKFMGKNPDKAEALKDEFRAEASVPEGKASYDAAVKTALNG